MTKDIQFLPDDFWLQEAEVTLRNDYFSGSNDLSIDMRFFWGVKDLNNDDVNMWDPSELGKLKWDNNFDISEPSS